MTNRQCRKCGEVKPLTAEYFFVRNDGSSGGFRNDCRACNNSARNKRSKKYIESNRFVSPYDPDSYKKCGLCEQTFPRSEEFYSPSERDKDGLMYACKPCRAEREQLRRRRHKHLAGELPSNYWEIYHSIYGTRCLCCGKEEKLTLDHVIPISWVGSSNYIWNTQGLCHSCNSSKNNNHATDYRPDKGQALIDWHFANNPPEFQKLFQPISELVLDIHETCGIL